MSIETVERMHRDHAHLVDMVARIKGLCGKTTPQKNCLACPQVERSVCQGNVEQLILSFVEMTLKHQLVESVHMQNKVPDSHRFAHIESHSLIAEQLKKIRAVFSDDGNCIVAIEGIDHALDSLLAHIKEFDQPFENYLLATA